MIYRASEQEVAEYYERPEMNQSSLKFILEHGMEAYLLNMQNLLKQEDLYYEEKSWFIMGTGVDTILTFGKDIYDKNYYLSTLLKKPGATVLSVLKHVYDTLRAGDFEIGNLSEYREAIWLSCNQHEYYMNRVKHYREDTRVQGILTDEVNITYWEDLQKAGKRQILSDEQATVIKNVSDSFLNHPNTSFLFKDSKNIDLVFQYPLYFDVMDTKCKALPDEIYFNHDTKKIIPIDFKTLSGYVSKFNQSARKRRYDLQAAFYLKAIDANLSTYSKLLDKDVTGYNISRFAFVVESTTKHGIPLIFPVTEDLAIVGRQGDDKDIQGYLHAMAIFEHWRSRDFSLQQVAPNGVIFLGKDYEYNIDL